MSEPLLPEYQAVEPIYALPLDRVSGLEKNIERILSLLLQAFVLLLWLVQ